MGEKLAIVEHLPHGNQPKEPVYNLLLVPRTQHLRSKLNEYNKGINDNIFSGEGTSALASFHAGSISRSN